MTLSADNLSGLLYLIATVAAVLSLAASWALLWRYRRAVVRSMTLSENRSLDRPTDSAREALGDGGHIHPLQINMAAAARSNGLGSASVRRVAVYGGAGAAFAIVQAGSLSDDWLWGGNQLPSVHA